MLRMADIYSYNMNDVAESFSSATLAKGKTYVQQGRVQELQWLSATHLCAKVRGSEARPYTTNVKIIKRGNNMLLDGSCTCPMAVDCKHIAAVAIAGMQSIVKEKISAVQNNIIQNSGEHSLSYEVSQWLRELELPEHKEKLPQHNKVLIYVIEPPKGKEAYRVSPMGVTMLKAGHFSKTTTSYSPYKLQHYNHAAYITQEDMSLMRFIAGIMVSSPYESDKFEIPADKTAHILLSMLLETRRCFVGMPHKPEHFFTHGAPREASLQWKPQANGAQRVELHMAKAGAVQVLALHPPHYVCMETRTIGALTLPIPDAQAMAMLRSPEIAPEDVEDVRKKLRGVIKDAPDSFLPTPIEMERQLGTPSPHLKLGVATLQPIKTNSWGVIKAHGVEAEIACAELSFSYEGKRIYPHESTQEIRRMKERKAQILMRNQEAEQQYAQIIQQSGINIFFKDMKHLYHFHAKHMAKNTIGVRDNYFHKDKGLPAQWRDFMRITVSQLKQQGWKVTIAKDFPYNIVEADEEWYAQIAPMQSEKGSGIDWFGLELGITLDGQKLNLVPLLLALLKDEKDIFAKIAALPENEPLLIPLPDGRRLALPAQRAHTVLTTLHNIFNAHHTNKEGQLAFNAREAALLAEMQAAMASLSLRWFGGEKLRDLGEKLRNFTHIAHAALDMLR